MSNKLNIFDTLKSIDTNDIEYYSKLTDTERKEFVPFLVMQWLVCSDNDVQTILVNEFVNKYVFVLYKHPELLYYLMTICTNGSRQKYTWKKPTKMNSSQPNILAIVMESYECSKLNAITFVPSLSNNDIIELANSLGKQSDFMQDLKKELKKR